MMIPPRISSTTKYVELMVYMEAAYVALSLPFWVIYGVRIIMT